MASPRAHPARRTGRAWSPPPTTFRLSAGCSRGDLGASTGSTPSMAGRWAPSRPITGLPCFPELVARAIVNCGSARTAVAQPGVPEGPDGGAGGRPRACWVAAVSAAEPASGPAGLCGRIYAGWGLSQDFYRAGLHESALGAPDLDTFLRTDWEERFARRPAANLYAQLRTWEAGDISRDPNATAATSRRALGRDRGPHVLLDAGRDRPLFPGRRQRGRVARTCAMPSCRPIPSIWGHRAGNPSHQPGRCSPSCKRGRAGLGSNSPEPATPAIIAACPPSRGLADGTRGAGSSGGVDPGAASSSPVSRWP